MERRQLEYFVAVVERGGFARASIELNITQSAISQAIAQLETELGAKLFLRNGRHAVLTAAGHAALTPARQALRDLGTIRAVVADVTGLAGGRLEIATFPPLAEWPVAPVVGAFRKKFPSVTLAIAGPESARIAEVAAMVRDGRCELGFTDAADVAVGLISHPLAEQDYVAILPPKTPLSKGRRKLTLEKVVEYGLIVGPWWETSPPYDEIRARHPDLVQSAIAVRIQFREAYVPMIVSGAGAAILPRFVGEIASRAGAIVAELENPIRLKSVLVQRPGELAPAAREFRDLALKLFK
jgi:DNA-binding transcriptional LysR family regulator